MVFIVFQQEKWLYKARGYGKIWLEDEALRFLRVASAARFLFPEKRAVKIKKER